MRIDIKEAAEHTGLSQYAIRKAVWAKRFPVFRTGSGKMIFDTVLLDEAIRCEMLKNIE